MNAFYLHLSRLCLCLLFLTTTPTSAINWIDAKFGMNVSSLIQVNKTNTSIIEKWDIDVGINSNREIYRKDGGHFSLSITGRDRNIGDFSATTSCVEIGAAASDVVKIIKNTDYSFFCPENNTVADSSTVMMSLSNIMDVTVKRFGDGKLASNFSTVYKISFKSSSMYMLDVEVLQTACTPLQTYGLWNDARNWDDGIVPSAMDGVFFPANSGMVELSGDVTVMSLNMLGGTLILQTTGCNDGWSLGPESGSLE